MADYKDKLGGLADRLKKEEPKTPIQEVNPVKSKIADKEPEGQLNVWIPKKLLKKMKTYGVEQEKSQKDIAILALEKFLS
ncbi:hypothetical protein [Mucilaginibacter arboris]|uniref:CopG family transcriptional regulator n=1 Tax=Mucilaginibacter arboris TaxID=2682090 RepID=A0A7K1T1T9_9SPHI|nr:hypothetical protein [Mucilaginibacter arboris]MVN23488.1 hypothetical protein [Mucilaginibacter arboris]